MSATARLEQARTAYARNELAAAAKLYQSILAEEPKYGDEALQMLGAIAQRAGKLELALQLTEAALAVSPDMVPALINLAVILRQLGRKSEARLIADKAIHAGSMVSEAWHTASFLALETRDYDSALDWAHEAVRLAPSSPLALANYASALLVKGDLILANEMAEQALHLMPQEPLMHLTLGQIQRAAGYPAQAAQHFLQALTIKPDYTDACTAYAAALSVIGEWGQAWQAWEARPYDRQRVIVLPRWQGEAVDHLFVHAEQGMGDALQFLRYVPLLREKIKRLTLQVPQPLLALAMGIFSDLMVITPEEPIPHADAQVPLMSLPLLFNTTADNIPAVLNIKLDEKKCEIWRQYLTHMPMPRIGLVWSGNPNHSNDHNRSLSFEAIQPVAKEFGAHLLSLQNGVVQRFDDNGDLQPQDELLQTARHATGEDISSMAALMYELDLVITVDSLPAHLSGALQRPTWLMVPFDPDWRWLYRREDSPWYPSMRLFRQPQPKDWITVINRIQAELGRFIAGDQTALIPLKGQESCLKQHPQAVLLSKEKHV